MPESVVHPGEVAVEPNQALDAAIAPGDLAELMASFNEVTARLEQTHAQLRGEVRRLSDELRDANEALQRSRRLAALGEMAAGIAHEVRNPLGSIGLYARMLEEDLAGQPECLGVARKISSAVRGLDAIVGDVLTFSKEVRLRPQPGCATELFERAVVACRAECAGIRTELASGDDIEFEHDALLLQQAMVNVIRNACDASKAAGGSVITLSARRAMVDPGVDDPVPGVVLSVVDQGDGFPPGAIDRAFNPFFTTRAAGTGLGLPIVNRIADAHAGRVVIYNNADRSDEPGVCGATVEIRLPLRAPRASAEVIVGAEGGLVSAPRHSQGIK